MTNPTNQADIGRTPGDWGLEYDGSLVIGGQIINVEWLGPDHAAPAEKKANARLMSAAPHLLLACLGFISLMDDLEQTYCGDFEANYPGFPDALEFARAAVRKAR